MGAGRQPNVLVILADDMGPWAMGCAGNPEIHTPHLDRLAREGMRFDRFFCASPVCSPARASLLTGLMPSAHGVLDWLSRGNFDSAAHAGLGDGDRAIEYLSGIEGYTDVLARHGYTLGLSGKWHLGSSAQPQKGFSHWFAHTQSGGHYYTNAPMFRQGRIERQTRYLTHAITADAQAFIERQAGRGPFCCEVHYTAPHSPWVDCHPAATVARYRDCAFAACPDLPAHPWQVASAPRGVGATRQALLAGYFAAITEMDAGIGQLLETLERGGLRENTLVLFLSDNGMCMGHHGIFGKGNGTFPQNMYEESVRVPAIVSRPGHVPAGRVETGLHSQIDWFPTLADYLNLDWTPSPRHLGQSFAPLLRGQPGVNRRTVAVCDEYGPVRMLRDERWKYVHRHPYGPHELYDLATDPGETLNRIDDSTTADRVLAMRGELERFFAAAADPLRDGARQPVTGNGQRARLDEDLPRFGPRHRYLDTDGAPRAAENRWGLFPA